MAQDEAPAPMPSIQARIAALRLEQHGRTPDSPPPSYDQAMRSGRAKAPPPPLPKRPGDSRALSTNNPPLASNGTASVKTVGNQPAKSQARDVTTPKEVLPAPVMKKWEGRE